MHNPLPPGLMTRLRSGNALAFALPSLALIAFVGTCARSFPIWETWYFVPVWRDFNTNGPWLSDLFVNRWGHISALPNFINLMLDDLSGYDQRVDIVVSTAAAIAGLYLLLRYLVPREAILSRIFLGLTFLSIRVSEIWLDGWNTAMTISLLLSIAAGACVVTSRSWKALAAAAAVTFLGLNSGGYCLAILPAVSLVLLVQALRRERGARSRGIAQLLVWLGCAVLLLGYWSRLTHGQDGTASAILRTMLEPDFLPLFARMQAFILGHGRLGFALAAGVPVVFLIGLAIGGWRRLIALRALPGLLYMAAYTAVLTTLIETGRTSTGEPPLYLRYIPFLCLLPVALLALAETLSVQNARHSVNEGLEDVPATGRRIVVLALCLFIAGAVHGDVRFFLRESLPNQPQLAALDRAWRQSPWTLTPGMFLYRAATDPQLVSKGLETMRELRLGPFGRVHPPSAPAASTAANRDAAIHFGVDSVARNPDGNLITIGWSFDTDRARPAQRVHGQLGHCEETALTGLPRHDVARFFRNAGAAASGWLITFPAHCMAPLAHTLEVYFRDTDGRWNSATKRF